MTPNMHAVVSLLLFLVLAQFAQTDEGHVVETKNGPIRGYRMTSRTGKEIVAFKGIRYARAPIGQLRFAPPEKPDSWTEIFNATSDAPECIQKNYLLGTKPPVQGQEDCLFLNVFTRKIPLSNDIRRVSNPVMVYIHGGGWFAGTGNYYYNGPEFLLDEDIVLVTLNYRLGIFGFLSTEDDEAPGNWGLKDQKLALEWVRDNIVTFGGNPKSVTIFGQSAGSASVHYHVLSPSTKGLFHKAIGQSGSALNLWATPKPSYAIAKIQGTFSNCQSNKTNELVDCLRKADASALLDSGDKFKYWDIDPLAIFVPSIERRTKRNPKPFLEDHPTRLMRMGKFQKVPYIMGVMKHEGIIRAAPIISKSALRDDLNKKWNQLGPELFALTESVSEDKKMELWKNITSFYMRGASSIDENNSENIEGFLNMYTDRSFIYGVYQAAIGHALYAPTYFYHTEYAGKYSWSSVFAGTNETVNYKFNASHCDDLIYLFRTAILFPDLTETDLDFSKVMVKMWTSFARDGVPFGPFWTPLKPDIFRYLNMAGPTVPPRGFRRQQITLAMRTSFIPERINFWKNPALIENR